MRSQLFVPRSPTRFMGYLLRMGLYSAWMPERPLAHTPPWLMGAFGIALDLHHAPIAHVRKHGA